MPTLVIATRNQGKVAEIQRLLSVASINDEKIEIKSISDFDLPDVEETGDTFEANALLKAKEIAEATGYPALADDSGLSVTALGGAPGIYSARYSGRHGDDAANIDKLLAEMNEVPEGERGAKFIAVLALVKPGGAALLSRGELEGQIAFERQGNFGFGYDPIFAPNGSVRTLGEFTPEEKDAISHRGKALREIAPKIPLFLASR